MSLSQVSFSDFLRSYVISDSTKGFQYSSFADPTNPICGYSHESPNGPELKQQLISKATALGFDTTKLLFVEHGEPPPYAGGG